MYDTNADAVKALVDRGAKSAASAEAVASAADIVLMSLPTPPIVQSVSLGEGGILRGSRLKTLIDLSTTGPSVAKVVAKAAGERNVAWVDSPVSGGVSGAMKGTLAVMVSCAEATFPIVDPVLKNFGKTFYVGEKPGLAQIAKLANNLLAASAIVLSSEAMAMGVKAGLDAKVLIDIINAGSGRNSATQDKFPRSILPRYIRLRLRHRAVVQGRATVHRRGRGARRPDGGRRGRAADAGDYAGEVWRRLGLHVHCEGRRRVGGRRNQGMTAGWWLVVCEEPP